MTVLEELRKKYGTDAGFATLASELTGRGIIGFPTGVARLDMATGIGGLPAGRITEFSGPPAAGKTSVSLSTIAHRHLVKSDAKAAYVDLENALDLDYAAKSGVDLDRLLVIRPEYGEQAFGAVEMLIRSGEYDIVIVDSVPAISPRAEAAGEIGDAHVGLLPRLLSQFLRMTAFAIRESDVVVVFINQVRDKISRMPFTALNTPGGYALKHHTSLRIFLRNAGEVKRGDIPIGSRIAFQIKKNKVGDPYGSGEFEIWGDRGVCKEGGLLDLAVENNIITKAGAWFGLPDETKVQGRLEAISWLENQSNYDSINNACISKGEA